MSHYQADWIYNQLLRVAVIVALSTLLIGLVVGVAPLIAIMRSSLAFGLFAGLAWVSASIWPPDAIEENDDDFDDDLSMNAMDTPDVELSSMAQTLAAAGATNMPSAQTDVPSENEPVAEEALP